jgi:hypothetical protein
MIGVNAPKRSLSRILEVYRAKVLRRYRLELESEQSINHRLNARHLPEAGLPWRM